MKLKALKRMGCAALVLSLMLTCVLLMGTPITVSAADHTDHTPGTLIAEVPATATASGMAAHSICSCGTYFDANGQETTSVDLIIPAQMQFAEDFSTEPDWDEDDGIWSLETARYGGRAPTLSEGALHFDTGDSICFNWQNVPDVGPYSPTTTYTFEFDLKLEKHGTTSNTSTHRDAFVSFGGKRILYYLENKNLNLSGTSIYLGNGYDGVALNKDLHIKVEWLGKDITTTVSRVDGADLASNLGKSVSKTATSNNHANINYSENGFPIMTNLVFRCEDGFFQLDNVSLTRTSEKFVHSSNVQVPQGQMAVHSADVVYDGQNPVTVKIGQHTMFSLADSVMTLDGYTTNGTYGAGTYKVKTTLSPQQEVADVEVTLPDGRIFCRGSVLAADEYDAGLQDINVMAAKHQDVSNVSVDYVDNGYNEYVVDPNEPEYTGFQSNVYNLVSSFDVAATTRNFAWTAKTKYIGSAAMAIRYRVQGEQNWTTQDARRHTEQTADASQDFFKVDLINLTPGTTYEYQIGKAGSENAADWSTVYTFTTANEDVNDFTFVALSDTQGEAWDGEIDYRFPGFMFAQATYKEMFEEVPNAAFMLHAGDHVELGYNPNYWNMFFKTMGEYASYIPNFSAAGNHDAQSINSANKAIYFNYLFNHPNNGGNAAFDQDILSQGAAAQVGFLKTDASEMTYSFDYGDAHFIVLYAGDDLGSDRYIMEAQRDWLIQDLNANTDAKWTVVMLHGVVYHRNATGPDKTWLSDVLESSEYGIDLVLQGHSHLYSRTYPMRDGNVITTDALNSIAQGTGVIYTTIGSTAPFHHMYNDNNSTKLQVAICPEEAIPTYTTVRVTGDSLTLTTKQINGYVLDSFTITTDNTHEHTTKLQDKKAPSYEADGHTGNLVCQDCKKVITPGTVIPKLVHTHKLTAVAAKAATCTDKGNIAYWTCECGDWFADAAATTEITNHKSVVTKATGHSWNDGRITKKATCAQSGVKTYTCKCGATKQSTIKKLSHSYTYTLTKPTCTQGGYTTQACRNCDHNHKFNKVAATGHSYQAGYCKNCDAQNPKAPAAPKLTEIAVKRSGVQLTWKKVSGGKYYDIYRATSENGTYKKIANNVTKTSYLDKTAKSGSTYYYKLVVDKFGHESTMSAFKTITFVSAPKLTYCTNNTNGIALKWKRVSGADSYAIYRKTGVKGSWKQIATIESGSTVYYMDKSAKNGTNYYYTVRAIAKDCYSVYPEAELNATRLERMVLNTATRRTSTSLKCTWGTSSAVNGYQIQVLYKGKVYKTVTIRNNKTGSKTITGLKSGRTYTVRIRSMDTQPGAGTVYSPWSATATVKAK